jgi:hypothetical protein
MSKAKAIGKKLGGITGTAAHVGVGAAAYGVYALAGGVTPYAKAKDGETDAERSVRMRKYSYAMSASPVALALAGHFLKKKSPGVSAAVIGAAGFALAESITLGFAIRKANPAPKDTTKGIEAGAMLSAGQLNAWNRSDTGAMLSASEFLNLNEAGAVYDEALDEALEM